MKTFILHIQKAWFASRDTLKYDKLKLTIRLNVILSTCDFFMRLL